MNVHTFEALFTTDLESFVNNPIQIEPLATWNPKQTASLERHVLYGRAAGLRADAICTALVNHNIAFQECETMFRTYLTTDIVNNINPTQPIHPIKEQVWLFGYRWLMNYYELMLSPTIMRTEFYKTARERFLALIASMLQLNPSKRPTFVDTLREWDRTNTLLQPSDEPAVCADEDGPSTIALSPPAAASTPVLLPQRSKGCLVLTQRLRSAGRNKTRRSPHNSGRCRSTDNRGSQTEGSQSVS